jgi:hypothetical protein
MSVEMARISVEPVCTLPPDAAGSKVTEDGHVITFCQQEDGKVRFCWDGVCGEPFDSIRKLRDESFAIFASQDGNHIAYVGVRGDSVFVGRDGREDPAFESVSQSTPPVFGGGGAHLAYSAKPAGGGYRLILDGSPVGEGDVAPIAAVFSPDGGRVAFVEMRDGGDSNSDFRIVLDGQPGEWFRGMRNAIGAMQFSPDGHRFAYYTTDGKGQARWFVDGVAQRVINDVRPYSFAHLRGIGVVDPPLRARFSPDSSRFAYFADVVEKGVAIIEDDVAGPIFQAVHPPVFSPDSRHLAYGALTVSKTAALVLDGSTLGDWPAPAPGPAVFSPNGDRVAMCLEREDGRLFRKRRWYSVAIDDRRSPEVEGDDASMYPTFSPDGLRAAWWLQQGDRVRLVVDGTIADVPWSVVSEVRFDPAGGLVYAAKVGASDTLVRGDQPGPLTDGIVVFRTLKEEFGRDPFGFPAVTPFRISASGRVAWAGVLDGRAHPILDDEVGPAFDNIIGCTVDAGAAATWWALRDNVVYRIDRPIDQPEGMPQPSPAPPSTA